MKFTEKDLENDFRLKDDVIAVAEKLGISTSGTRDQIEKRIVEEQPDNAVEVVNGTATDEVEAPVVGNDAPAPDAEEDTAASETDSEVEPEPEPEPAKEGGGKSGRQARRERRKNAAIEADSKGEAAREAVEAIVKHKAKYDPNPAGAYCVRYAKVVYRAGQPYQITNLIVDAIKAGKAQPPAAE